MRRGAGPSSRTGPSCSKHLLSRSARPPAAPTAVLFLEFSNAKYLSSGVDRLEAWVFLARSPVRPQRGQSRCDAEGTGRRLSGYGQAVIRYRFQTLRIERGGLRAVAYASKLECFRRAAPPVGRHGPGIFRVDTASGSDHTDHGESRREYLSPPRLSRLSTLTCKIR